MRRRLTPLLLALACGSSAPPPPDGAISGAVPGLLTLTVDGNKADFTDVIATFTGPPYNRLRVSAHRGTDPMLEEVQVVAAGDSPLHTGAYSCADQSETSLFYSIGDDAFDDEGDCTVNITRAVSGGGQEATGSFTGVVSNGSVKKALSGTFRVGVMPSN